MSDNSFCNAQLFWLLVNWPGISFKRNCLYFYLFEKTPDRFQQNHYSKILKTSSLSLNHLCPFQTFVLKAFPVSEDLNKLQKKQKKQTNSQWKEKQGGSR